MRPIFLILFSLPLLAQTVPIDIVINFPPRQLVAEKYGPTPKWSYWGEVIACNKGTSGVTYGQGDVIALLRVTANLQAFSIQDAMLLVQNSQNNSAWNKAKAWIQAGATTALQLKAAGIIGGGNATGAGIVIGAEALNIFLPNLQGALSLKQVIQYSRDGLPSTMNMSPGRCTIPYSVLFAAPGPIPATSKPLTLHVDVPVDR